MNNEKYREFMLRKAVIVVNNLNEFNQLMRNIEEFSPRVKWNDGERPIHFSENILLNFPTALFCTSGYLTFKNTVNMRSEMYSQYKQYSLEEVFKDNSFNPYA